MGAICLGHRGFCQPEPSLGRGHREPVTYEAGSKIPSVLVMLLYPAGGRSPRCEMATERPDAPGRWEVGPAGLRTLQGPQAWGFVALAEAVSCPCRPRHAAFLHLGVLSASLCFFPWGHGLGDVKDAQTDPWVAWPLLPKRKEKPHELKALLENISRSGTLFKRRLFI